MREEELREEGIRDGQLNMHMLSLTEQKIAVLFEVSLCFLSRRNRGPK